MNPQTLFDTVVTALRAQGRKSLASDGRTCLYRSPQPDGTMLKCAAGHVLPDALYSPSMEQKRIRSDACKEAFVSVVGEAGLNLLGELQIVHDGYRVEEWEDEWRRLALSYGLTYTPLIS